MVNEILEIKSKIDKYKKVAFISGNFNILHIGHQRLFKFAKENADVLVVGVNRDDKNRNLIDAKLRLEGVINSIFVDYALIIEDYLKSIELLKPDVVIKGREFENQKNLEFDILKEYGGKLIFNSGDIGFSSYELLINEFKNSYLKLQYPKDYLEKHNISNKRIAKTLNSFSSLKVAVIGDTIVDEYVICDPIGMSQEDPTIVVTPISSQKFLGGASIVAAHAASLGAYVDFYSVIGDDEKKEFLKEELKKFNVNSFLFEDDTRPTTVKKRFRANEKTLLRVNYLKSHTISKDIENEILSIFQKKVQNYDILILSDFSYGVLSHNFARKIIDVSKNYDILISADSQSSSQTGDIKKFKNVDIVTPTEREARLALNDFESGLVILSEKIAKQIECKNLIITLAQEGVFIFAGYKGKDMLIDRICALNLNAKDVAGAGDSFLVATTLAYRINGDIWESAYIGSLAAAIQVGRVGNTPLNKSDLLKNL